MGVFGDFEKELLYYYSIKESTDGFNKIADADEAAFTCLERITA